MKELSMLTNGRTGTHYPMSLILRAAGYSSSTWYCSRKKSSSAKRKMRQNKVVLSDAEILVEINKILSSSIFHGEGYRKTWMRLRRKNIIVDKDRVNAIMRDNNLLSPYRHSVLKKKRCEHNGTITTAGQNRMWGTDGKRFYIEGQGWHWFFGVIDHYNDELLAWHTAKIGNRFAAMEPVKMAIKKQFGRVEKDVCTGMELKLRSDHGTQYDSKDFMEEMEFLGVNMSKSFVRSPQCNGCIERFNRTIEEEVFSIERFHSLEEANEVINSFIEAYNKDWMIHRLGCLSPIEYKYLHLIEAA
ncbi:MAG TPA: integrase core domain-containing protein [Candidatus Egerieousia sp.]|nr:integrase core domain-containing protein [Candidatus Egerieousia sp.]